jgi:hypothetical protein
MRAGCTNSPKGHDRSQARKSRGACHYESESRQGRHSVENLVPIKGHARSFRNEGTHLRRFACDDALPDSERSTSPNRGDSPTFSHAIPGTDVPGYDCLALRATRITWRYIVEKQNHSAGRASLASLRQGRLLLPGFRANRANPRLLLSFPRQRNYLMVYACFTEDS